MLIPVILSGGTGSRLWPISREAHPKPFMKLVDGQTLLQKTFLRAAHLDNVSEIITVTNRDYYFKSKDEYEQTKIPTAVTTSFILEPFARNTAPAIAFAALKIVNIYGPDCNLLVLAADHLIEDQNAFAQTLNDACKLAGNNKLVTFGITPTGPETGFGYIECGSMIDGTTQGYHVIRFSEKPDAKTAQKYIDTGRYLWNSGIFCFKAGLLLEQLKQYSPKLYQQILTCWEISTHKTTHTATAIELDTESFDKLEDISIDFALMEKSTDIVVLATHFGWNDIGSWNAVGKLIRPDQQGNAVIGKAVLIDASNTFIQSENRMIASIGVNNLIIIDTPDALLVADRHRTQDVKHVVQHLKNISHNTYKIHRTVQRPWGSYTILEEGQNFKIKRIVVKPYASLSLQVHHHRSEHWIVVSGTAKVINGEKESLLNINESTFIPAGHRHRLENLGVIELVLIEVQTGEYLGEDDIVRFEDKYGRT